MKKILSLAITLAATCAFAGTPTMDGTFDGTGVWGTARATNSVPGWAGVTITDAYSTNDATYAYFGCSVTGMASWQTWGMAISSKPGGCPAGTQEPWSRQINLSPPSTPQPGGNADFVARGTCNDGWRDLREWSGGWNSILWVGSDLTEARCGANFIECRIPKGTLNVSSFFDVFMECFISGDNNTHGTFSACPTDQICTQWNEAPPNVLDNPTGAIYVPVTVSAFEID